MIVELVENTIVTSSEALAMMAINNCRPVYFTPYEPKAEEAV